MWACLVAQTVKNSAAMQVTQVRSLGWEDPLEKGRVTPFSNLAWRIPWTEKPDGRWSISAWGCKELDSTERLTVSLSLLKMYNLDHLGGPVVKILPFQCGRGRGWRWVRSLVRELRSLMPRGQKKKKKNQHQKDNAVALITVTTVCIHHTIPEFVHHPRKNRCTH